MPASTPDRPPEAAPARPGGAHPLHVLLADPNRRARRAVAAVLGDIDGVVVVGEVDSGADIADAIRRQHVDMLVIDDGLLPQDGRAPAAAAPVPSGMRLIVLGVDDNPTFAARARRLGAEAWIAKDAADEGLHEVLDAGRSPAVHPA
jgi:DNA-binding NarL/FixJ family response regulator